MEQRKWGREWWRERYWVALVSVIFIVRSFSFVRSSHSSFIVHGSGIARRPSRHFDCLAQLVSIWWNIRRRSESKRDLVEQNRAPASRCVNPTVSIIFSFSSTLCILPLVSVLAWYGLPLALGSSNSPAPVRVPRLHSSLARGDREEGERGGAWLAASGLCVLC